MTYDEIKALVEKLDKFRQLIQTCVDKGWAAVMTDEQDHLLREAILCIEELDQKARQDPVRYYSSTSGKYDDYLGQIILEQIKRETEPRNPFNFDVPFPKGLGNTCEYKSYPSFAELSKAASQVKFLKNSSYPDKTDPRGYFPE